VEIDTNENHNIVLKKVFNSIVLVTEEGNKFAICMRDDGIEILTEHKDKVKVFRIGENQL